MRSIGPNPSLLAKVLRESEEDVKKELEGIKDLYFTPVFSFSSLRFNFDEKECVRRNIREDLCMSLGKEGLRVKEFLNYSGIPEAYDFAYDMWDLSFKIKAEGERPHFQYEGDSEVILYSSLRSIYSFNEILKEFLNKGIVTSFILDYGRRDYVIDVFSFNEVVRERLEYVPFIRYSAILESDQGDIYLTELMIPKDYLLIVLEVLKEMREEVEILFTKKKIPYFHGVI
ncbi:MAG: hypothetical protein MPF33_09270 [Candidatus Aramenus sp.]|jgi:hypothetical protein|nr:hypothetical protein [Candidatus Aramenus sp.]